MRQRITFIHKPEDAIDPEAIQVGPDVLKVRGLVAAREDRITLGFNELPEEIRLVLDQSHELHLRYVKKFYNDETAPFLARLSPGLHVFYSPQRSEGNADLVCPLLNEIFKPVDPARCKSPQESFTLLPAQRFQHSTAYEYYLPQSQIGRHALVDYLRFHCPGDHPFCHPRTIALQEADSIDIDFDAISHALVITVVWHPQQWNLDLSKTGAQDRLEVGILSNEQPIALEELSLAGFLTVVGEDTEPSPTLFSFPARHHRKLSLFSSEFIQPTGLHPNLLLHISDSNPPPKHETCSLHAYLTLPRAIFPDKYQLQDPLFMASKNLSTIRYVTSPVDLEAPEYAMPLWGSSLLLELAAPPPSAESWTAEVPLHLRYLAPTAGGMDQTDVPWPVLFWACTAEEGSKFTINPFDRVNLGYDGLFGPRTMFYHLVPKPGPTSLARSGELYSTIQVPVLDTRYSRFVEAGTTAVILLGCSWILWRLYGAWTKYGYKKSESIQKAKKTQ